MVKTTQFVDSFNDFYWVFMCVVHDYMTMNINKHTTRPGGRHKGKQHCGGFIPGQVEGCHWQKSLPIRCQNGFG